MNHSYMRRTNPGNTSRGYEVAAATPVTIMCRAHRRLAATLVLWVCAACGDAGTGAGPDAATGLARSEWPAVGGDAGGMKYSPLDQIDRSNVADLRVAWVYRTGEAGPEYETRREPRLSATPVVAGGVMYAGTPLGRVIALDPETGAELWTHDPGVDRFQDYGDFTSRGVAVWTDTASAPDSPCAVRIFMGTIDARLLALDSRTGSLCRDFGRNGEIDLRDGLRIPPFEPPAYQITSPVAVIGDLVVTGSAIADNSRVAPASGEVRAWNARTGALRWSWDPIPQDPAEPAYSTWAPGSPAQTGAGNVWSSISADPDRNLVFVPTTSPSPDHYGGLRIGRNVYANSIVALDAATGRVVWSFQTVRHDLWDYDNPAQPSLVTLRVAGREVPAVLAVTKTGQLFVLHRDTGEPVFAVEERPVPPSDVPGEEAWPTQPFSRDIEPLSPHRLDPDDVWGATSEDLAACRESIARLRNEGIHTPPSLRGTLVMPSNIGGAHWGGVAFDPVRQLAIVPVNRIASMVQLIPADGFDRAAAEEASRRLGLGYEYNIMRGTPYALRRRVLLSPSGLPCSPPPFGTLVAIDLTTGERAWEVPLGSLERLIPEAGELGGEALGAINLGGPIVTAGGLVFIAGTPDNTIRAFDVVSGEVLWRGRLPASARATPATYSGPRSGRQFVAVAAGGGGIFQRGDHIVAFTLP